MTAMIQGNCHWFPKHFTSVLTAKFQNHNVPKKITSSAEKFAAPFVLKQKDIIRVDYNQLYPEKQKSLFCLPEEVMESKEDVLVPSPEQKVPLIIKSSDASLLQHQISEMDVPSVSENEINLKENISGDRDWKQSDESKQLLGDKPDESQQLLGGQPGSLQKPRLSKPPKKCEKKANPERMLSLKQKEPLNGFSKPDQKKLSPQAKPQRKQIKKRVSISTSKQSAVVGTSQRTKHCTTIRNDQPVTKNTLSKQHTNKSLPQQRKSTAIKNDPIEPQEKVGALTEFKGGKNNALLNEVDEKQNTKPASESVRRRVIYDITMGKLEMSGFSPVEQEVMYQKPPNIRVIDVWVEYEEGHDKGKSNIYFYSLRSGTVILHNQQMVGKEAAKNASIDAHVGHFYAGKLAAEAGTNDRHLRGQMVNMSHECDTWYLKGRVTQKKLFGHYNMNVRLRARVEEI